MPESKILVDMVFFMRNVLPVLEVMGWTVRYGVTDAPPGHLAIHAISDTGEPLMPPELREKFTRMLDALAAPSFLEGKLQWRYAGQEENLQYHYTGDAAIASALGHEAGATPPAQPGSRPLPPLASPVFDYTTLREDPENDRRIREYSEHMIVVKARDMVQVVKPNFAARGWVYGGNHYGDGSVAFQVVLDADDKVVAPADVLAALRQLQVPHGIHDRRPEPRDEGVEDGRDDEQEGEDGRPPSLDAAEAERQEAMDAARAGALRLEKGQEMHFKGVCDHATDVVELRLEIGDNVITVVSTYQQAKNFMVEATVLYAELLTEKGRILATAMDVADRGFGSIEEAAHESKVKEATGEETESDGGKESERDDLSEQRQGSE